MRVVIQRVKKAAVNYEGVRRETASGYALLVGIGKNDTEDDLKFAAEKIINMRVFSDENGKFNYSLADIKGEILAVPQFTLYGECLKGRRPDFTSAAEPGIASEYFDKFVRLLNGYGLKVETGKFAADMLVEIFNDGPVTIIMDTELKNKKGTS